MDDRSETSDAPLDGGVLRWLARQMLDDARARLVDVGADLDQPVQLADVFVDLPLEGPPPTLALQTFLGPRPVKDGCTRWLLVGGAGSGKTTLSTMLAQVLRRPFVLAQRAQWAERDAPHLERVCAALGKVEAVQEDFAARWLPIRVDLPTLAGFIAATGPARAVERLLSFHIAETAEGDGGATADAVQELLARGDLFWIFDGLDEVPTTAQRDALLAAVREVLPRNHGRVVVTTRPQGYAGEFAELKTVALAPLSPEEALAYAVQLTRAWVGAGATELEGRLDKLRAEVGRAELGDLLRVPLHVAMVALQVARDGKLPASRWLLFDRYVARIFDRELRKNLDNGIVPEDAGILRLLHARVGLLLQMRGAFQEGARPLLLPRELRAMVVALCTPDRTEAEAEAEADRLLRFADERLVLLLRESATGYGFAVRSLQEFFAAEALREEPEQAAARVGQVALDPYWLNVVLLVASHAMCAATPHEQRLALACTAGVCEALDAGTVRREAVPSFATPEEWARFGFPGTFPGRQPPPLPPVRLASIDELTNLRLFKDTPRVDAPLPTASYDAGQWIVLLGENGVGKTTLLRALALALAPDGVATKLLDDRLPMVRNGGAASVRVTLDGRSFAVRVERDGAPPTERVVSDTVSERPWVVGYGVRRGNARGESDREPEQGPYGALHTLFERPGTLHHATRWILDLRRRLLEEEEVARKAGRPEHRGPERRTWDGVERALQRVLPDVQKVEAARDHVMVRHRRFGLVRLDALSDGYLTTAGWVVDLIARWVERQRARFEPVNDLLREMVGIVLLDEIDLHLHPVWQMRIIEDVRALFPRLSFVVTTHNPLALQGARKGEVFVMRHDAETGVVELAQRDILPGYDVDRVLLEQFGVAQTFDRETRRLLDEYRALRAQSVPVGHPRRRELEEELEVRLGPVGRRVVETQRGPEDAPRRMSAEESEAYRRELRARRGRT